MSDAERRPGNYGPHVRVWPARDLMDAAEGLYDGQPRPPWAAVRDERARQLAEFIAARERKVGWWQRMQWRIADRIDAAWWRVCQFFGARP